MARPVESRDSPARAAAFYNGVVAGQVGAPALGGAKAISPARETAMLIFMNDWKLTKKLFVSFGILALLTSGVAVSGYLSNKTLSDVAHDHVERSVNGMSALADLISDVKELRIIVYSYYAASENADMAKLEERLAKTNDELDAGVAEYIRIAGNDLVTEASALTGMVAALHRTDAEVFARKKRGDTQGALAVIKGEGKTNSNAVRERITKLIEISRARAEAANLAGQRVGSIALLITTILSAVALGSLAAIWLFIDRTVAKPMAELTAATVALAGGGAAVVPHRDRGDELGAIANAVDLFHAGASARAEIDARAADEQAAVTEALGNSLAAMTQGDLTAEVSIDFPPPYAALKTNFNAALASLRALIGAVAESTAAIRTGSSEIAQASEDLARRTETNAASLEETAAAITQMDQRLKATASAATRTVERADGAITTVSGGRAITDEAVQAMTRVAESAKGIDGVIEGLDKIAFQTRVLAMNAAVEAGRAGEAGRGFAVVADLVSALAMRAEEEAGRARDQLTATQADIVTAVQMVEKVDGALANISSDVSEVHTLLSTIASDNQAQSSAITEVSSAIGKMDQSTQQNAAMVQQTSSAARNLTGEVSLLADQATRFTIGTDQPRARSLSYEPQPAIAMPIQSESPARKSGYVSPVKALPIPAEASAFGGGEDDWNAF